MLLSQRGHEVVAAVSGEDAIRTAKAFRPEVGLLDIGMPGMDGYELAAHFRGDPLHARMYLIAVTGWGDEDDRRKALQAGFDAHLTKPADLDELTALLEREVSSERGARPA